MCVCVCGCTAGVAAYSDWAPVSQYVPGKCITGTGSAGGTDRHQPSLAAEFRASPGRRCRYRTRRCLLGTLHGCTGNYLRSVFHVICVPLCLSLLSPSSLCTLEFSLKKLWHIETVCYTNCGDSRMAAATQIDRSQSPGSPEVHCVQYIAPWAHVGLLTPSIST